MSEKVNTASLMITKLINQMVMQHLERLLQEMSTLNKLNTSKVHAVSSLSKVYSILQKEYNKITNILGSDVSKGDINTILPLLIDSLFRISLEATAYINEYLPIDVNKLDQVLLPTLSKVAFTIPIAAGGLQAINMMYILYNAYKLYEQNSKSHTSNQKEANTQFSVYSMILEGLLEVTYKLSAMNSHSNNVVDNKKQLRVDDLKNVFTDIKSNLKTIYSLLSINNITNIIKGKEDTQKFSTAFQSLKKDIDILSSGYAVLNKACKSLKALKKERNLLLQIIRVIPQITNFSIANSIAIQKYVNHIATNEIVQDNSKAYKMPEKIATQNNDSLVGHASLTSITQDHARGATDNTDSNTNTISTPANNSTTDNNAHLDVNSVPMIADQNILFKNMREAFSKMTQNKICLSSKDINNFISKLSNLLSSTSKNNVIPFKQQVVNHKKTNNIIEL